MTVDLASGVATAQTPVGPLFGDIPADPPDIDKPRLPVWQLAGLLGAGAFAFWASLTCFVC